METKQKTYDINGIKSLNDCINFIVDETGESEEFAEWILKKEDDATIDAHLSIGQWLRNILELWYNGPPTKYFNEMGIYHADDISDIILTSTHRRYNNLPLKLDEEITEKRKYWQQHNSKINEGVMQ